MFKKKNQQDEKSTNRLRVIVYIFAIAAILSGIVNVVSKYIHTNNEQAAIKAHEFYFESNQLFEDGREYEVSPGTSSITVELKNYPDDLRFAQSDIAYVVEVTESSTVVHTESGTLKGGEPSSEEITFNVEQGKTYIVTATGTKGFEKVLTGTFKVEDEDAQVYTTAVNTDEYIILTVWTKNIAGDVTVKTIPTDLIPDNTNEVLKNLKQGDTSFTDSVNFTKPYSSYSYRFFKTIKKTYAANTFMVRCAGKYAPTKTPEE